jgi:predicted HAD superfamily Cof-like phosphohydrolase
MITDVREFHAAFNHYISDKPTLTPTGCDDPKSLHNLRVKLIREELEELEEALAANDIVEVADAISDLLYVVVGAGVVYGIPMEETFAEVHRSNMTKLGEDGRPILNGVNCDLDPSKPLGKVIKGPNFREPDFRSILGK